MSLIKINYNIEKIRRIVREEGIQFFPHKIMHNLLYEYVRLNGKTKGFIVAGARNIRELGYLSAFFEPERTYTFVISASHKTRYNRYNGDSSREHKNFEEFIEYDDTSILTDLQDCGITDQRMSIINNDHEDKAKFEGNIKERLSLEG